jgi:hypothetical protein
MYVKRGKAQSALLQPVDVSDAFNLNVGNDHWLRDCSISRLGYDGFALVNFACNSEIAPEDILFDWKNLNNQRRVSFENL